ncbi:MAG: peptide deformylase [Myxococcales bacterium]|nr:peptide deformylase [Myxococcales bacterium]
MHAVRQVVGTLALLLLLGCAHGGPGQAVAADPAVTEKIIVQWRRQAPDPNSVLRQRALPVQPGDDVAGLLDKLRAALWQTGGVGIAAPQLGVSRRVFLIKHFTRPAGRKVEVTAYLDPEVVWHSDETQDDYEACLSVAQVGGKLPRWQKLRLRYRPESGGPAQEVELADWDARIAQHELDHLDGTLYIDRVVGELTSIAEMRRLRDEGHRARGWIQ